MTTYSELRIKHAKRIADHVMRANKISTFTEGDLVDYILSGGSLRELLNLGRFEKIDESITINIAPRVSATSLSITVGSEPNVFIDLLARALSNTQEAEVLKSGLT